ncbi:MAG: hypothetical protein ACE5OT_05260 [Candidatus Hadarchaeaceae archaeon]
MFQILVWLLPIVDVFAIRRIMRYYSSFGVRIPWSHAKTGLIERWVGYLPAGFVIGWFAGFWMALLTVFIILAIVGPIEFCLMYRGVRPWRFFKGKPPKLVAKIFLLEGYNAIGYYLLGGLLTLLVKI